MATFDALDEGLKWPKGTAHGFHKGVIDAKDQQGGSTPEELVNQYVQAILTHILAMDIDELEREVLMLEEEAYGRQLPTDPTALDVIRETVARLTNAMGNGPALGKQINNGAK